MGKPPVTIYSTPTCGFCKIAKKYFEDNDIEFEEINVASSLKRVEELVEISGQLGVPVIMIGNRVQVGWDKRKFEEEFNALSIEHSITKQNDGQ